MKICLFGQFDPLYPRNRIFIKNLKNSGIQVIICYDRSWFVVRFLKLWIEQSKHGYDILFVPYASLAAVDVLFAKIISIIYQKPLIFDAFISLYDTNVNDRRRVQKNSFYAFVYWLLDYLSLRLADRVICDTQANIDYFVKNYHLSRKKFHSVLIGSDESVFKPKRNKTNRKYFKVIYWGNYIPLHGMEYIIKAANLLRNYGNIKFYLLGSGQEYQQAVKFKIKYQLDKVFFLPSINYVDLPKFVNSADLVLGGPFGSSRKAQRVIPNKVYEALACRKAVIVGDTLTMRNTFKKNEVFFCACQNDKQLANLILYLSENPRILIAKSKLGFSWYQKFASNKIISQRLLSVINF